MNESLWKTSPTDVNACQLEAWRLTAETSHVADRGLYALAHVDVSYHANHSYVLLAEQCGELASVHFFRIVMSLFRPLEKPL